jgi:hypothetical protein
MILFYPYEQAIFYVEYNPKNKKNRENNIQNTNDAISKYHDRVFALYSYSIETPDAFFF